MQLEGVTIVLNGFARSVPEAAEGADCKGHCTPKKEANGNPEGSEQEAGAHAEGETDDNVRGMSHCWTHGLMCVGVQNTGRLGSVIGDLLQQYVSNMITKCSLVIKDVDVVHKLPTLTLTPTQRYRPLRTILCR